jgi:xanthine dehydrogenase YagS FAD-binding subunit
MCVALAALDATVRVQGPAGERSIAFADYHRLPGDDPSRDNILADGDLVLSLDLPAEDFSHHYSYLKLRDRLSYAFALVSVAAALQLDDQGRIVQGRVALGGVAHKPWRVPEAEALMEGREPSQQLFLDVSARLLLGAQGRGGNDFKIELARRAIVRALRQAAAGTPQSQSHKKVA